jgi:hypothetical protein
MSTPIAVPDFSGEPGDAIQSAEFLKKFRALMNIGNITSDARMNSSFENYLKYNSPADEWFKELNTSEMTWKALEKAFLERFPPIQKAKKSESELERELCELRLKADELGKKEKYAGEEVWSHVAFAERALSLARQAKINTGSNSIWKVRDELPEIIRQKVKETYATWDEFCTAIKEVDTSHIRDGVKKYQKEKEEKERMESLIASLRHTQQQQQRRQLPPAVPLSPMSNASNAMGSMAIGPQQSTPATTSNVTQPAAPTNSNPFASPAGGRGNLFNRPQPVTDEDREALARSIGYYPLQPNTTEGINVWHQQLRDWRVKNGDGLITAETGFPLRPGGAEPGSGECFQCGQVGHRRDMGQCRTTAINGRERTYRTICGRILRSRPVAQVNAVDDAGGEFDWLNDRMLAPRGNQGNGEGPSV